MTAELPTKLMQLVAQHWGFHSLRPLQTDAIRCVLAKRDSLVVLPTGGGKSLCYQAPAVFCGGLTVVLSPLIALMKDQVDGLARNGIPAVRLDSTLSSSEWNDAVAAIRGGQVRLAFASPERLVNTSTYQMLRSAGAHTIAIDEAHCISHWGHDFRPEYRMLARLREFFPQASIHAYTATATEQVRHDIAEQLNLREPTVLVGNFDRPNLTYRVLPQLDMVSQVRDVLDRHRNEAGIIYCLRRKDVDQLTDVLRKGGYKAVPYHAGMTAEERSQSHDAFASEEADVVVATIAFGMGIDRSNVRFVLHVALPKSIEHYQQETGRAGRDGLPSECVLLFSGADVMTLISIIEKSALEGNAEPGYAEAAKGQLDLMARYARGAICRHKALVQHFGQVYDSPNCGACDLCLGDTQDVPDAAVVAQKILSCVARVNQTFGVNHVVEVLRGANTENIRSRKHDQLTTYGILKAHTKTELRDWIYQLIGQDVLVLDTGEYPTLKLNKASWAVMKGEQPVRLIRLVTKSQHAETTRQSTTLLDADPDLFEELRQLRRQLAVRLGVPPYQVFADTVLAEMSRSRPTTPTRLRTISGVGDRKFNDFGEQFLDVIRRYVMRTGATHDLAPIKESAIAKPSKAAASGPPRVSATKQQSYALFREGASLNAVVKATKLTRTTIVEHLADFISQEKPATISAWVSETTCERVAAAAEEHGTARMKPVFEAMNGEVPYDAIRLVFAYLESQPTA
jgi:ATP-dependent DNA helicase RecQ